MNFNSVLLLLNRVDCYYCHLIGNYKSMLLMRTPKVLNYNNNNISTVIIIEKINNDTENNSYDNFIIHIILAGYFN